MQSCLYLDPSVRSYLEEIVKDPQSFGFKETYSTIVNEAVVLHAMKNGKELVLQPIKRRGRRPVND